MHFDLFPVALFQQFNPEFHLSIISDPSRSVIFYSKNVLIIIEFLEKTSNHTVRDIFSIIIKFYNYVFVVLVEPNTDRSPGCFSVTSPEPAATDSSNLCYFLFHFFFLPFPGMSERI